MQSASTLVGFHCSHEQHPPSALLQLAIDAEHAGFGAAMCSDHFHPWLADQGHSGFAWSWLGAALHATRSSWGTVCAPGQRYHPAVIAQAAATLADMFPQRFWLAVGSGEALNEAITGGPWLAKPDRRRRLQECVDVIRALWAGERVTHHGLVTVVDAALYSRPQRPPPIVAAAITPDTARWAGTWADALVTVTGNAQRVRRVIDAFQETGPGKPMYLQAVIAFGRTDDESARMAHHQWRHAALDPSALADLPTPDTFGRATASVSSDDVVGIVRTSADVHRHAAWLHDDFELGFSRVYVHNVVLDHRRFFESWSAHVLPQLERR